jgi:hypothetical protein
MNNNVHPLVVALVLLLTALAIAIWMWGSGEVSNIGGPAEVKADPDGHIYVQIHNSLVEHDANGKYLETHDLHDLGVDVFLGSFAFFSNGDILLRRGPDPRSVWDNIRAFRRQTNRNSLQPESDDSGMFRCSLETRDCTRFAAIDFKTTYGIFIDWQTDDVYFADTSRHVLRKYSADGSGLAGPVAGFKFPNQIMLLAGQLLVADTNHHVIQVLDPNTFFAGENARSVNVIPTAAAVEQQVWPSHFARVGEEWWVNNMRTGMNYGGLYIFDDDWGYQRKVDLPLKADPIAIVTVGNEVWVSDWYKDRVRRFSFNGDALPDLESAGLEKILADSRVERRKYELLSYSGIALFFIVLAVLAIRAFALSMNKSTAARR